MLESELFGHEKGAFTGADSRKLGRFEVASGGTMFMDEIGDMPLETQAKLLRVIQDGQFERVGGLDTIKVDVRFVAATNKELSRMVTEETFREDLFFRLNVFSINLPPLRDRREDIPILVERFMERNGQNIQIASESMQILTVYDWPGNVRELKNAIESATVLANDLIEPLHLPAIINQGWRKGSMDDVSAGDQMDDALEKRMHTFGAWEKLDVPKTGDIDQRLQQLEKDLIIEALKKASGVQVAAAKYLGIKERSLWHRIKKFKIDISEFKRNSE
ncbi:sigma 54-interacting transcriptional regulator [Thermodesulfobacteriota bacterium]